MEGRSRYVTCMVHHTSLIGLVGAFNPLGIEIFDINFNLYSASVNIKKEIKMKKVVIVLFLLILLITPTSCEKGNSSPDEHSKNPLAKNFSLASLNGTQKVMLEEFKGKPVIINFWASWCSPCRQEIPFFENTWKEYKDRGVVFIGINVMDDKTQAETFIKTFGITYLNLQDQTGEVASTYGVIALPATFFIDKEGRVHKKNYGPFLGEGGEKNFRQYLKEISD